MLAPGLWKDTGRVTYTTCEDDAALEAFFDCCKLEGILPAVETAHAIDYAMKSAKQRSPEEIIVVCLSGRGDKDVNEVARVTGMEV